MLTAGLMLLAVLALSWARFNAAMFARLGAERRWEVRVMTHFSLAVAALAIVAAVAVQVF